MSVVTKIAQRRSGAWLEEPGFGVYVHIPFCAHRCHYCDFNTYEGLDDLHSAYVDALIADIERTPGERPATSVFFGGGTPTLLEPPALARILDAIRSTTRLAPGAEITVEANPETVDERTFDELLDAGFNRFSIGVQSLAPHVLRGLGRTHSAERALDAFRAARAAGATDVNLDLIYGSVWERSEDWVETLLRVVDEVPDHISAYALTIEEGTPLATLVATGRVADVEPDVQAERFATADELLSVAGFERYEISNWARPGHASVHNVLYWSAGDYLGFGAGAHGHLDGLRFWSTRLPRDYIDAVAGGATARAGAETLSADQRAGEALMLGLRLSSGIDTPGFVRRFGGDPLERRAPILARLHSSELIRSDPSTIRLTDRGVMVANEVQSALL